MTKITLGQIREHHPCKDSWFKLLKHFGKDKADDTEVTFKQLIDVLGVGDAIWCLRCLPEDRVDDIVKFAADCADRVLYIFEKEFPDDSNTASFAAYCAANTASFAAKTFEAAVYPVYADNTAAYYAANTAHAAAYSVDIATFADNHDNDATTYANATKEAASAAREVERKAQADLLLKYFGDE